MSPTYDADGRFLRDLRALSEPQRKAFMSAVATLVADLKSDRRLRPGLRVKRVQGSDHVWEMTWAPDGRATWEYGDEVREGEPHIIWRRVGSHDIFRSP